MGLMDDLEEWEAHVSGVEGFAGLFGIRQRSCKT